MTPYARLIRTALFTFSALTVPFLAGRSEAQLVNGDFSNVGSLVVHNATPVIADGQTFSDALPGWTAVRGELANSNVYVYGADPDANSSKYFFLPNPPAGFTHAVQLDGSTGNGSQERFNAGSTLTQNFSLLPGTYQLSFYISTEIGRSQGVTKGGTSGVLVDLFGSGLTSGALVSQEFTVTSPQEVTRANDVWQKYSVDFSVAARNSLFLSFTDDPADTLGNNLRSSNVGLGGIEVTPVPEAAPLAMVGAGAAAFLAARALQRRRQA